MAKRTEGLTRAEFLKTAALGALAGTGALGFGAVPAKPGRAARTVLPQGSAPAPRIMLDDLKSFAKVAGLSFTDAEYVKVLEGIDENLGQYEALRKDTADYE